MVIETSLQFIASAELVTRSVGLHGKEQFQWLMNQQQDPSHAVEWHGNGTTWKSPTQTRFQGLAVSEDHSAMMEEFE